MVRNTPIEARWGEDRRLTTFGNEKARIYDSESDHWAAFDKLQARRYSSGTDLVGWLGGEISTSVPVSDHVATRILIEAQRDGITVEDVHVAGDHGTVL